MPATSSSSVEHGLAVRGALRATIVDDVALRTAVQVDAVKMEPAGSSFQVVSHDVVEMPSDDPAVRRYQARVRYATVQYTDVVKEIRVAAEALASARVEDGVLVAAPALVAGTPRTTTSTTASPPLAGAPEVRP